MAIFRGDGGAGDSTTDATLSLVTAQAVIATTKASESAASAVNADGSKTAAATSATSATASASAASAAASGVTASATAAAASATAAAASSTSATTAKNNAETAETNAETAETNAETAETNAAASAATSTTKAAEAATSAATASTGASTATTKASEASASASAASTSEGNASTSATGAASSASGATSSASAAASSATASANSATAAASSAASIGTDPSFNSVTVTGSTAVKMPVGTTAERPTPVTGQLRYNSTLAAFEGYTTEWGEIGGGGSTDISLNTFTGDGSDVTFSLSAAAIENNTFVYIDGVYQSKSNYSVSAADPAVVTFSTPPPNTTAIEIMVAAISVSNIGTPSDNTVTTAKIVNDAVTTAKIVNDAVTTAKIVDDAVTTAKIADANVTTAKIVDGAITAVKLAAGVGGVPSGYISTTPTTSSSGTNNITITNHSSYSNPQYALFVGTTPIAHTEANNDGVLTISSYALTGSQTVTVHAANAGSLFGTSNITITIVDIRHRYWRLANMDISISGDRPFLSYWQLYDSKNALGTNYGTTTQVSGGWQDASYPFSGVCPPYLDQTGWGQFGRSDAQIAANYIQFDLGSAIAIQSVEIRWYTGANYWSPDIDVQYSDNASSLNGSAGWTTQKAITGMAAKSTNIENLY